MPIFTYIKQRCIEGGDRLFIKDLAAGKTLTYSSLWKDIKKAASYLNSIGLKRDDRFVLEMENSVHNLVMFFGALITRVVPVIVSPRITPNELDVIAHTSGSKGVVVSSLPVSALSKALTLPVWDIKTYEDISVKNNYLDSFNGNQPDKTAYIMFTSGSTDIPKQVEISSINMLSEIKSMAEEYGLISSDRHLCVLPIYHASGLYRNILIPFHVGGEVVLMKRFDVENFWETINKEIIHFVQVGPSILKALLMNIDKFRPVSPLSLKCIGSASAPHPLELLKSFEEQFGINVLLGYGMTEATCGITLNQINHDVNKTGSVGRPLSVNRISIWNEEDKEVPACSHGRVMVIGKNISSSASNLIRHKEKHNSVEWLDTGDYGYLDEDDFLWIKGRKNGFIKRGEHRISPEEIEEVINSSFPEFEVAVLGVHHPELGQDVVAFISSGNKKSPPAREIIRSIKGKISSYKIPSQIIVIDELPKLGVGKINKKKLATLYEEMK